MVPWQKAEVKLEIPTAAEYAFGLISDFESYPNWQRAIKKVQVLKTTEFGKIVEFEANLIIRNIRYVLDYYIDRKDFCLRWNYVEGDILNTRGEFRLLPLGLDKSLAVYRIEAQIGFWVAEPLLFLLKNTVMSAVLHDLAKEAKRRKNYFTRQKF